MRQGAAGLKAGSPFRYIAETGLEASTTHEGAARAIDLNTWVTMSMQRAIDNVQSRLQDGLAFLATVGSTAPFVGLFGTVWGIYHALTAIGIAGQASIDKVAGPGGRGADHDGDRPGRRGAGGARLQLAGPPQQGRDGTGAQLSAPTCTRC